MRSPQHTEPGLLLKATPPRVPKDMLARTRLRSDASEFADRTAVVFEAPAGFGKTSLLGQWRREWLARGAIVAWLTLDERDDVPRFVAALEVAMRIASARRTFAGTPPASDVGTEAELENLTAWLASVAEMATEAVVVLDDAHLLPEHTGAVALLYLIRNAPPNLRVVIASRGAFGLPAADLVAHGELTVITADRLRFSLDETVEVLRERVGSQLDADRCARLHEITEGWPLGLQLAVSVLRQHGGDLTGAIDGIEKSAGDIERYFASNLVARLAPTLTDLLVRLSVVDAVHPSLAVALSGNEDAPDALAQLTASTPIFIDSVESPWTRIHPLARQFLQARFAELPDETRRAVHERAMRWLGERGHFEEAARHALTAGLTAKAWELIERQLYDILLGGNMPRVLEWADRLPAEEVGRRPRLARAVAWALAMGRRPERAEQLIDIADAAPSDEPLERLEWAMIRSASRFYADDPDGSVSSLGSWLDTPPSAPPHLLAMLANQGSIIALLRGQPERARYLHLQMPRYGRQAAIDAISGFGDWVVGLSYLWEGQAVLAEGVLRPSLRIADAEVGRRSQVALLLSTTLAAALWDRNLPADAALVLANRLDAFERLAAPEAIVLGYVTAARIAGHDGDERRAIDLLQNLDALGEARGSARMRVMALAEQVCIHARHRRIETTGGLMNRLRAVVTPQLRASRGLLAPRMVLALDIAASHDAIARGDPTAALAALESASRIAERLHRGRELIEIRLLRVVAGRARTEDMSLVLAEALSLAESYGLARLAADTHPSLAASEANVARPPAPAAAPSSPTPAPAVSVVAAAAAGVLTSKESQVLGLVARNLSNKQIALALGVGDETVKWHLKNLFGKLNAGTRDHLVARARMLGLLAAA
jgi:LuxR family maltose regulon positive regulatory protein